MVRRHGRSHRSRRVLILPVAAVAGVLVGTVAAFGVGVGHWDPVQDASANASSPTSPTRPSGSVDGSPTEPAPSPSPAATPDAVFTIVAGGDVLPHTPVDDSARTGSGFDFGPLLAGATKFVSGADLALCHMEVPIGRQGAAPHGYPRFLAPNQVAGALAAQGWDGCSTASNHSLDQGMDGLTSTLDALDAAGLGHAGTARSAQQADAPQLYQLQREGRTITVAHIAAAYGTNGLPVPANAPWALQLIDVAQIIAEAKQARAQGADLVVVSIHAGTEYRTAPTAQQRDVAAQLAASGQVDLVIGHHAHVPQPIEKLPGGPTGTGMWVAYGLGNFISNQDDDCCAAATDSGILLTATVTAPASGPASVSKVEWTAITVDRRAGHRVRLLTDALANPAGGTLSAPELQARYDRVRAAVGTQAPERTTPPVPTGPPPTVVPQAVGAR